MNAADLRLGRVVLRGTAGSVARARAELPAALARSRWPVAGDDAILVLRRVAVSGTLPELPARAAAATEQIARRAADPWSPAADGAEAVRFRDALDYRACLARDLLAGTAARRWLWRHRAALPGLRPAGALAALLAEDALALPALLDHPGLRVALPALWHALDAPAARVLLHAIGTATGWSGAIAAALDAPPDGRRAADQGEPDRDASGHEQPESSATRSSTTSPDADVAACAPPPASSVSAEHAGIADAPDGTRRPPPLRWHAMPGAGQAIAGLAQNDPRTVLQAVLGLWAGTPATLGGADAGQQLRDTAHALARATPAAPAAPAPRTAPADTATARPARSRPADEAEIAPSSAPAPEPPPLSSSAASTMPLPPAAEHDFLTRGGGLFFLLNVLNLPALRGWRAALAEPQAGWRELARLAVRIGAPIDPPLAAFLAEACGLDADTSPAAALAALGTGHDSATVDAAAHRFRGDAALAALRAERPARVRASASHVDVHLGLADASLDIRRAGLDIDPGWLPWLGRVVRFHYDRGGFMP